MGLLSWLFGTSPRWIASENGNPTTVIGNHRITVFPQDAGFKFCAAFADRDDRDPYFSDVYRTESHAKESALAHLDGRASPHVSLTEDWQARRTIRAQEHLREAVSRLSGLEAETGIAKNVTALRKIEAKITSTHKSMTLALDRALHDGLSPVDIQTAEHLRDLAERLRVRIQERIAALKR